VVRKPWCVGSLKNKSEMNRCLPIWLSRPTSHQPRPRVRPRLLRKQTARALPLVLPVTQVGFRSNPDSSLLSKPGAEVRPDRPSSAVPEPERLGDPAHAPVVWGEGGHAARPHQSTDPIALPLQFIAAAYQLVPSVHRFPWTQAGRSSLISIMAQRMPKNDARSKPVREFWSSRDSTPIGEKG